MNSKPAERILHEIGISEPSDIDVVAIANHMGASVKFSELSGYEASIVGIRDKAIIRVQEGIDPTRQRFSVGHECGHWHFHRGREFKCRSEDIGNPKNNITHPERIADSFAADLLMPGYLVNSLANNAPHTSFTLVNEIQELFKTSKLASALRAIDLGPDQSILICHNKTGRLWFHRSPHTDEKWFPSARLDEDSVAYDIIHGQEQYAGRRMKMPAEAWFDFDEADDYEIMEQSISYGDNVLTILTIPHD